MKSFRLFFPDGETLILQADELKREYGELRFYIDGKLTAAFGVALIVGWMELLNG